MADNVKLDKHRKNVQVSSEHTGTYSVNRVIRQCKTKAMQRITVELQQNKNTWDM